MEVTEAQWLAHLPASPVVMGSFPYLDRLSILPGLSGHPRLNLVPEKAQEVKAACMILTTSINE